MILVLYTAQLTDMCNQIALRSTQVYDIPADFPLACTSIRKVLLATDAADQRVVHCYVCMDHLLKVGGTVSPSISLCFMCWPADLCIRSSEAWMRDKQIDYQQLQFLWSMIRWSWCRVAKPVLDEAIKTDKPCICLPLHSQLLPNVSCFSLPWHYP